jgi:hypothetical protein
VRAINEIAQWGVLIFLSVFVLGLTRQLGGVRASARQRRALARGVTWAGELIVDDRCLDCEEILAEFEQIGQPVRDSTVKKSRL